MRYYTRSKGVGRGFHKYQDPDGSKHRAARFGQATGRQTPERAPIVYPTGMQSEAAPTMIQSAPISEEDIPSVDSELELRQRQAGIGTSIVRPYSNPLLAKKSVFWGMNK